MWSSAGARMVPSEQRMARAVVSGGVTYEGGGSSCEESRMVDDAPGSRRPHCGANICGGAADHGIHRQHLSTLGAQHLESGSDNDATRNHDQAMYGRTRERMFFNFIASDDLRGVFAIERYAVWGLPRRDFACSGCYVGDGADGSDNCGFGQNNDINNFRAQQLYVDFRVPQLPIGNRTQLGGLPPEATPLHGQLVLHGDFGGE